MKCVERSCCFETNSSSQHVFVTTKANECLTPDDIREDLSIWNNKIIMTYSEVSNGFGRSPFQILDTFEDKLAYLICEYCGDYHFDSEEFKQNYDMMVNEVKKILPEITGFEFRTEKVAPYLDINGNELRFSDITYRKDEESGEWADMYLDAINNWHVAQEAKYYIDVPIIGSIDHQSIGMVRNFVNRNHIDLSEFLIKEKYIIFIDGDERQVLQSIIDAGLFDFDYTCEVYGI